MDINKNENNLKLISLIVSHNPPITFNKLITQLLLISEEIIIIDSSTIEIYNDILKYLKNERIVLIHEKKHYGLGNALNLGIDKANQFSYDFLLIMEDDSFFINNGNDLIFKINSIIQAFSNEFDINDVLYLSEHNRTNNNKFITIKNYLGSNSGLILNYSLCRQVNFRADFFMDQIDIDFQYKIKKMGGNLILTKNIVIDRLPIGRESNNQMNTISIFRFYLLTRNSIILFIERKISIINLFFIPGYFFKGLLSSQNAYNLLIALLNGIIDGFKKNSGITKTLKRFRPDLD